MTKNELTLLLMFFTCIEKCYNDDGMLKAEYYNDIRLFNIDDETFDKVSKKKLLKSFKSLREEFC